MKTLTEILLETLLQPFKGTPESLKGGPPKGKACLDQMRGLIPAVMEFAIPDKVHQLTFGAFQGFSAEERQYEGVWD